MNVSNIHIKGASLESALDTICEVYCLVICDKHRTVEFCYNTYMFHHHTHNTVGTP